MILASSLVSLGSLVKGAFDDDGGHPLAAAVYLQLGARLGQSHGHVAHADVLLERRGGAARGDLADRRARGVVNRISVTRDPALGHLEADELARQARGALFQE